MSLNPGSQCGSYEIVGLLGTGGMGEVYRARDAKLGRQVAIKVLGVEALAGPGALGRFQDEARAASALNHPGIVTIHDLGELDGQFFIVMELVDGTTLRQLLGRGPLPLKKTLQIASQLADALAKAHEAGIVHCDLKPENVMLTGEGHVKIVDFGLAKLTEPAAIPPADPTSGDRTTERMVFGTVGYMSPEQASGESADYRADQFAFGAILYEMATGSRAFQKDTGAETLSMIIRGDPERPLALNPSLPLPLVWTIERCLSKDLADRYTSTRDLARDLQTLRDHGGDWRGLAAPRLASRIRRPRLLVAAVAIAVLSVAGTAAYFATRAAPSGPPGTAPEPTFQQLTFKRGLIQNARFSPDGQTIIYAAGWDGGQVRLFEARLLGPESRLIGPPSAGLASISSAGEVALILNCQLDWARCVGTLARMPMAGGAPREVLEDVVSADWTPDGRELAAIQVAGGAFQIQFPLGRPLYETTGRLDWLAFSPRGDRLAFIEYPLLSEESGSLKIVDLEGRATTVTSGWRTVRGMDWSSSDEIWVTGSDRGRRSSLYGVSLDGAKRLLLHAPADLMLMDLLPDRRALLATTAPRTHMIWSRGGDTRDLSWLDWSTVADLSADGKTVLFYEWGEGVGAAPIVYARNVDGSDVVRLGAGKALALSPDGRWALALQETSPPQLVLMPTGAGEHRPLPTEGLTDFYWARFFPDGRRILVVASDAEQIPRSYIQDTATGKLDPIGDEGMLAVLPSPDGRSVLIDDPLGSYLVWPLDGGKPMPVDGLTSEDKPIQWSPDGRFLYLRGPEAAVLRIHRYNLATGQRQLWKTLAPGDPAGLIGIATGRGELAMTPDGQVCAFTYWTVMRGLFLGAGLSR